MGEFCTPCSTACIRSGRLYCLDGCLTASWSIVLLDEITAPSSIRCYPPQRTLHASSRPEGDVKGWDIAKLINQHILRYAGKCQYHLGQLHTRRKSQHCGGHNTHTCPQRGAFVRSYCTPRSRRNHSFISLPVGIGEW